MSSSSPGSRGDRSGTWSRSIGRWHSEVKNRAKITDYTLTQVLNICVKVNNIRYFFHWKPRVVMMPTFSSTAAPQAVVMTACVPTGDEKDHNNVIKWKRFPSYWPLVRGIRRSPVEDSPHKGPVTHVLMFFDVVYTNNRVTGDLRRQDAHCDVTVMLFHYESRLQCHKGFKFKRRAAWNELHQADTHWFQLLIKYQLISSTKRLHKYSYKDDYRWFYLLDQHLLISQ